MEKNNIQRILEVAIFAGRIMLENGAETSRVEDTINRICLSRGIKVENFTIPTGIFLSYNEEGMHYPYIIRTKSVTIDLEIIAKVNAFSRQFVSSDMTTEEAQVLLEEIMKTPHYPLWMYALSGGIAGGFFTLSFGGTALEALAAFITSCSVVIIVKLMANYTGSFVRNIAGGLLNALIALLLIQIFEAFGQTLMLSKIVIGSLMPLVPGVAMTNAFRDSISGDFVSGVSKLTEALLIAVAIALGVGVVLHLKFLWTGSV